MRAVDQKNRILFAELLERLAKGEVDSERWQQLAVAHYSDETLERVRRDCVRLRLRNPERHWSDEETERLLAWAKELRSTPA